MDNLLITMTRLKEYGSWSEQTSSSGKRYYYNKETEVSQWEKPTEWREHEKALMEKYKLSKSSSKSVKRSNESTNANTSNVTPSSSTHQPTMRPDRLKDNSSTSATSSNPKLVRAVLPSSHELLRMERLKDNSAANTANATSSTTKGVRTDSPVTQQTQSRMKRSIDNNETNTDNVTPTSKIMRLESTATHHATSRLERSRDNNNTNAISVTPTTVKTTRTVSPITHDTALKNLTGCRKTTPTTLPSATVAPRIDVKLPIFNEVKYTGLYRIDLTVHRRNWSSDAYTNEARKCAEKNVRQTTALNSIDDDICSVYSLIKAAEVKCILLEQKLVFVRGQISNLESKNHSSA